MKQSHVIQDSGFRCDCTVHSSYISQAGLSVMFLITYDCFMTLVSLFMPHEINISVLCNSYHLLQMPLLYKITQLCTLQKHYHLSTIELITCRTEMSVKKKGLVIPAH